MRLRLGVSESGCHGQIHLNRAGKRGEFHRPVHGPGHDDWCCWPTPTDRYNTMPGAPLSLLEGEEIGIAMIEDRSTTWAEIARRVCRHPTTVAREVDANGNRVRY
jgi:hypothetical protein